MSQARVGAVAVTLLVGLAGACSFAGLDDYASGSGGHATTGTGDAGTPDGDASACTDVCAGACADLLTDPVNCGTCGLACAAGYECLDGVCGNVPVDVATALTTCVALRNGEVWCWGLDLWGEVGIAPASTDALCAQGARCQSVPAKVAGVADAVQVAVGGEASCARTTAGDVYCWGSNMNGLLGHDPASDVTCTRADGPSSPVTGPCSNSPTKVALPQRAAQLVVGSAVACVRTVGHDVYCWGSNRAGELAAPAGGPARWQPTQNTNVGADVDDVAVSSALGVSSTVCVTDTATHDVRCWGQSNGGDLFPDAGGTGCSDGDACDAMAHAVPQVGAGGALQIGERAGCALSQGAVTCWGNNAYGQSGQATLPGVPFTAAPIAGPASAQALSMHANTTLIVDAAHAVWGLGQNDDRQIGETTIAGADCPIGSGHLCADVATQIPNLPKVARVFAGAHASAAIALDGRLFMWGTNGTAALGHAPDVNVDPACSSASFCHPWPTLVMGLP